MEADVGYSACGHPPHITVPSQYTGWDLVTLQEYPTIPTNVTVSKDSDFGVLNVWPK